MGLTRFCRTPSDNGEIIVKLVTRVLGVPAAAAALAIFALTAQAQQPGTPPAKAPAAKSEPKKETPKKDAAKKVPKKSASACKGLAEAACTGNTDCTWVPASKRKAKGGKKEIDVKAYCRSKPKSTKKAADKKMDDKGKK